MRRSLWIGVVLLVIGAATVAGFRFFAAEKTAAIHDPIVGLEPWAFSLVNGDRETPVEIGLPAGKLWQDEESHEWKVSISFETWGLHVADIAGAAYHTERFADPHPIAAASPRAFLLALVATESYEVHGLIDIEIDRRAAVSTIVRSTNPEHHLDVRGEGGIHFELPNQVVLTQFENVLYLIQFWAEDEMTLEQNRPLMELILASVKLGT